MKRALLEISLIFFAFYFPGFLWQYGGSEWNGVNLSAYMIQFIFAAVPQILLILYIIGLQKELSFEMFGIVALAGRDVLFALMVYVGIFALLVSLSLITLLLHEGGRRFLGSGYRWHLIGFYQIPLAFLYSLATGYREELFFRAYLLTRFSQIGISAPLAVILSVVLFSAGHLYQGPSGIAVALILGTFFSVIFSKKRNLHIVAVAHALHNITILSLSLFLKNPLL